MMPPVSLPLNAGTMSARAGTHENMVAAAIRTAALVIRIAYSVYLNSTLERIGSREKRANPQEADLLAGVAVLHLTLGRLRGTVGLLDHSADGPCATYFHLPEKQALARRSGPDLACWRSARPPRRPIRLN